MRRIRFSFLIGLFILSLTGAYESAAQTGPLPPPGPPGSGVVTGGDTPSAGDVTIALQMIVGLRQPSSEQLAALDLNFDGQLRVGDAVLLLRVVVGQIPLPTPPTNTRTGPSPLLDATIDLGLEAVAEGLTSPVFLTSPSDGSGRIFIVDQIGLIRILNSDGTLQSEPFLDVRQKMVDLNEQYDERGLLGLAFHPDYSSNGRFFVYYSAPLRPEAPEGWDNTSTISEFRVSSGDPNRADPNSERVVLQVDQPQANHAGGTLAFGPDRFLYVSLGDGGGANDTGMGHTPNIGNGQDTSNLLGSILRIDVDGDEPYGIPTTNPFVNTENARDEIYAYGFRNPYRFSFDRGGNRELFVADAGQELWEEVSLVDIGRNYGWNIKEGTHCFNPENPEQIPDECPETGPDGRPLVDPIIEIPNTRQENGLGQVIVGGYVYRGSALPDLNGRYLFGVWSVGGMAETGALFVANRPQNPSEIWPVQRTSITTTQGGQLGHYLLGFGEDSQGELYVLTTDTVGPTGDSGRVFRLVPPSTQPPPAEETVDIVDLSFNPQNLTVAIGTTVTWTNKGNLPHTTTSGTPGNATGMWDSGTLAPGESFSFTFNEQGTFDYFCTLHPSQMQATITVTGETQSP